MTTAAILPTTLLTGLLAILVVGGIVAFAWAGLQRRPLLSGPAFRALVLAAVAALLYATILLSERPVASFDSLAWGGLLLGGILALSAIGLTMVYGILNLSNFAHGELLTLGAYVAFMLVTDFFGFGSLNAGFLVIVVASGGAAFDALRTKKLTPGERATLHATSLAVLAAILGMLVPLRLWDLFLVVPVASRALFLLAGVLLVGAYLALRARGRPPRWARLLPILAAGSFALSLAILSNFARVSYAFLLMLAVALAAAAFVALRRPAGDVLPWIVGGVVAVGAFLYSGGFRPAGLVLAALVSVAAVVAFVLVLDLLLWRRLRARRASILTLLIVSIGVALALRHFVQLLFGGDIQRFGRPPLAPLRLGTIAFNEVEVLILGSSATLVLGVYLLLKFTRVGKAMRALSDNAELARITGIDTDRIVLYVWAIAGSLAAVAGVLYGYWRSFRPTLGWDILLATFAAVILGGIGSPVGALAGALSIGLAMEMSTAWIDTSYKAAVAFVVLILLLLVRPQGLFGGKVD